LFIDISQDVQGVVADALHAIKQLEEKN
jgi:hypothetical protein